MRLIKTDKGVDFQSENVILDEFAAKIRINVAI